MIDQSKFYRELGMGKDSVTIELYGPDQECDIHCVEIPDFLPSIDFLRKTLNKIEYYKKEHCKEAHEIAHDYIFAFKQVYLKNICLWISRLNIRKKKSGQLGIEKDFVQALISGLDAADKSRERKAFYRLKRKGNINSSLVVLFSCLKQLYKVVPAAEYEQVQQNIIEYNQILNRREAEILGSRILDEFK